MKNQLQNICLYPILLCFLSAKVKAQRTSASNQQAPADFKAIETEFIKAPDSIQTSVYWYWISGNISKDGVIKDLEAMKKVGINRAFLGDIGLSDIPSGKVKFRSEEWRALKKFLIYE